MRVQIMLCAVIIAVLIEVPSGGADVKITPAEREEEGRWLQSLGVQTPAAGWPDQLILHSSCVGWALPTMGDSVGTAHPTRSSEEVEDRLARGDGAGDAAVVWGGAFDTDGGLRSRGTWLWHTALLAFDCRANLSKPAPTAGEPREPQ